MEAIELYPEIINDIDEGRDEFKEQVADFLFIANEILMSDIPMQKRRISVAHIVLGFLPKEQFAAIRAKRLVKENYNPTRVKSKHPHHDLAIKYAELMLEMLTDCRDSALNIPDEYAYYESHIRETQKLRRLLIKNNNGTETKKELESGE